MSVRSVGPRVGDTAVRIGACRKAEAVSPKVNPPSGNSEAEGKRTNSPRAISEAVRAEKRSSEPEGQLAEGNPEAVRAEKRKREPEGQPAQRQPRSGAGRKTEAVSPKANPPSGNPKAAHAEKRKP